MLEKNNAVLCAPGIFLMFFFRFNSSWVKEKIGMHDNNNNNNSMFLLAFKSGTFVHLGALNILKINEILHNDSLVELSQDIF